MPGLFDDLVPGGSAPKAPKGMTGMSGGTPAQQAAATAKARQYQAVQTQLETVQHLYEKNLKGVGPGSILEYLPLPANKAFDSAASGLGDAALAAFRIPGSGPMTDKDQEEFIKANQPVASDQDAVIEQKLANIRNRLSAMNPTPAATAPAGNTAGWSIKRVR